jgi:hypothetical protein
MTLSGEEAALYGTPSSRARDLARREIEAMLAPAQLARRTSYADALTAAVMKPGSFEIDGLRFAIVGTEPTDYVATGRHTLVLELAGTGKTYRLMIEPVAETHR